MRKNDSISTKDYKLKKNGGITLIALVITIIILLILADENWLVNNVKDALDDLYNN